jgi:hypothetical protein
MHISEIGDDYRIVSISYLLAFSHCLLLKQRSCSCSALFAQLVALLVSTMESLGRQKPVSQLVDGFFHFSHLTAFSCARLG